MKEVHIIGTGPGLVAYDWPEGVEKWSVGSAANAFITAGKKIDTYFCLHTGQATIKDHNSICLSDYPIMDIIKYFSSRYFTNSIGYMIAYAIFKGYERIVLIGIDMEVKSEYEFERPCVAYWIGQADARGIEVVTQNGFCDPIFLYGYNDGELARLRASLLPKIEWSKRMTKDSMDSGDKEKAMGFYGKARAYEIMLAELQGD